MKESLESLGEDSGEGGHHMRELKERRKKEKQKRVGLNPR